MFYREDGAKSGAVSAEAWQRMSVFEKNCWGWEHLNTRIEGQLRRLPPDRWTSVRLEELASAGEALCRFVGVAPAPLRVDRHNAGENASKLHWERWGAEERGAFERACGAGMDRWYAGWRRPGGEWQRGPFLPSVMNG